MSNRLIVASAGSGKTTLIVKTALSEPNKRVAIITFTNENELWIKKTFFRENGCVPSRVTIKSWYAFLIQYCAKPYQGKLYERKIRGLCLTSAKSGLRYMTGGFPVYFKEEDTPNFYFDKKERIYSDKVSKFVVRCNDLTGGLVFKRLAKIFDKIYFDEVQDFAGYDYEIMKLILYGGITSWFVGDPRQTTYRTHYDSKHKMYNGFNLGDFFLKDCPKIKVIVDNMSLVKSYRNNEIVTRVSSKLFPELPIPLHNQSTIHHGDGIFFIAQEYVAQYLVFHKATQLRLRIDSKGVVPGFEVINIGKSKGLEFDRVLLFPTKDMVKWLMGENISLADKTKSQLYVALTRARYSVAIAVSAKEFANTGETTLLEMIPISLVSQR